ncbi:MAG: transposase [Planctomycetes bacterium]|nr:transposase [Planctomycetota bacterium]
MDRYWFLTWRTYGTWLPGDERGFVDPVVDEQGRRVIHNTPGTPVDADNPRLRQYAREIMRGQPILLTAEQATALHAQFQETATFRGWQLVAVAIQTNHVHLIVGVPGDPDPTSLLRDFKSYGSRCLNRRWATPASKTWWAESGSCRVLKQEDYFHNAIQYVLEQENPLLTWHREADPGERPA